MPSSRPPIRSGTRTLACAAIPLFALLALVAPHVGGAQDTPYNVREHCTKREAMIPMRDSVKRFTILYAPNVATTGTVADFVVKPIDVDPGTARDPGPNPTGVRMGGFQMLLASDILHVKFRNSVSKPEPMVPGAVTARHSAWRQVLHVPQGA